MPAAQVHLRAMTNSTSTAQFFFFFFNQEYKERRFAILALLSWGVSWADILEETGVSMPGG
jgi:hypothetical protein